MVPDPSHDLVHLTEQILLRGQEGWIISKCISFQRSNLPFLYYKNSGQLNNLTFGFHLYQTKNGILQWNVRSEKIELEVAYPKICPPSNFQLYEPDPPINQAAIDSGSLLGCHLMFRCEEEQDGISELRWFEIVLTKVIPLANRVKTRPFQYAHQVNLWLFRFQ